jgi:hypothetical protein
MTSDGIFGLLDMCDQIDSVVDILTTYELCAVLTTAFCNFNSSTRKISQLNINNDCVRIHILSLYERKSENSSNDDDDDICSTYIEAIYSIKINIEKDIVTISTFAGDCSEPCYTKTGHIKTVMEGLWMYNYCNDAFSLLLVPETKFKKVKLSLYDFLSYRKIAIKERDNAVKTVIDMTNSKCKYSVTPAIFAAVSKKALSGSRCLCVNYSSKNNSIHSFDIIIDSSTISLSVSCPRIVLNFTKSSKGIMQAYITIHKNKMDYCGTVHEIDDSSANFSLGKLPDNKHSLNIIANKIWSSVQIPVKEPFRPYSRSLFHPAIIVYNKIQRKALI